MGVKCANCGTDNTQDSEFCKKCGTQIKESKEKPLPTQTIEAPREELTTGSTFAGRYQIIEEIGSGGMGKAYKVLDKEINAKIALKLIKPEIASDKKTIERFRNELKTARDISHKNICRMYDLNKEEDSYYITMEYVDGQNLRALIRQTGHLAVGTALNIAKQVCEGLSEAHRLGIVHRDLKPSNVMIDQNGNARIMDFGIARSLESRGITGAGVMIGTPEYMSPEQAEAKDIDQRSDIYSFGVILYEMLTGKVPFEGDTPLSIAVKHKTEYPPDPSLYNAQIPNHLRRVILHCLEKDKGKRYQNTGELLLDLKNVEKDLTPAERIYPKRRFKKDKKARINKRNLMIGYAIHLSAQGKHDESFEEIKIAQKLDPLSIIINTNVAWMYYFAREYDAAIEQFKKSLEMDPNFAVTHLRLGRALLQKGLHDEAIAEFQKAVTLTGASTDMIAALGQAYAVSGKKAEAEKIHDQLLELSKEKYVSSYELAVLYIVLDLKEKAFDKLERAYIERCQYLVYLKVDPRLDILRSEPRFKALLERINLN